MTPMRHTQRRKLVTRAQHSAEQVATAKIAGLLKKRYMVLKHELRRAGFNRRQLGKLITPVPSGIFDLSEYYRIQSVRLNKSLFKADDNGEGGDWNEWADMFSDALAQMFADAVTGIYSAESKFWLSREQRPAPVDPAKIVAEYQARTGRQIKNIADDTRDNVLRDITAWYNTDAGLKELIDQLGQYFSESRAESIARTESTFIASQVAIDLYGQFNIEYWNSDLASDPGPCPSGICQDMADNNPHTMDEDFPPYHVRCQCGTVPAQESGKELIYGADN